MSMFCPGAGSSGVLFVGVCGLNVSRYFGVKRRTRAIRKKASSVFLSILFYRIMPAITKRVAAHNSFGGQVYTNNQPLFFKGGDGITGTGRGKPTIVSY